MSKPLEKTLWRACMFAKKMQNEGMSPGLANYKAGLYYGYSSSEVGTARQTLKMEYGCRKFYKKNNGKKKAPSKKSTRDICEYFVRKQETES